MYEKTKNEMYAESWLKEHELKFKLIKQYFSKTKYVVKKDGITENFELPSDIVDIELYMKAFEKDFGMKKEIEALKASK
ncbi:MAG: hypothetical protein M0R51_14300 [Clostridia bacterium]|nr:hypothetical protein [Clostridia bacterium]